MMAREGVGGWGWFEVLAVIGDIMTDLVHR